MEHHGRSGCRHTFTMNGCPAELPLPGYCGTYSANASSAFCYGRFVFTNDADANYVYFFSAVLGAWQGTNLAAYNLTLATLCDSQFGDIYAIEAAKGLNPGTYGGTAFDPVIRGRNSSNFVWFDAAGDAHHQSTDASTSLNISAGRDHVPLDRRGIIKMFHCGPVMTEPVVVYVLWYGTWNTTTEGPVMQSVLPLLIAGLSSSPYWTTITNGYFNASGAPAASSMIYGGKVDMDPSDSLGMMPNSPADIIKFALNSDFFDISSTAMYLVLTTADIKFATGGLETACGYHDSFVRDGEVIKWGIVGDLTEGCNYGGAHMATGLLSNTLSGDDSSPNGNTQADSVITTIVHEITETVTDPIVGAGWSYNGFISHKALAAMKKAGANATRAGAAQKSSGKAVRAIDARRDCTKLTSLRCSKSLQAKRKRLQTKLRKRPTKRCVWAEAAAAAVLTRPHLLPQQKSSGKAQKSSGKAQKSSGKAQKSSGKAVRSARFVPACLRTYTFVLAPAKIKRQGAEGCQQGREVCQQGAESVQQGPEVQRQGPEVQRQGSEVQRQGGALRVPVYVGALTLCVHSFAASQQKSSGKAQKCALAGAVG